MSTNDDNKKFKTAELRDGETRDDTTHAERAALAREWAKEQLQEMEDDDEE